jgi:hypothetical protein
VAKQRTLGQINFIGYHISLGVNKTSIDIYWNETSPEVKLAWEEAAEAVMEELEEMRDHD